MSTSSGPSFPPNPNYGSGYFRRRILLEQNGNTLSACLEDTNHGFRVTLSFANQILKHIDAEPLRTPFDACPGAIEKLKPLIGLDRNQIHTSKELNLLANATANCTHLLDLTILAILFYRAEETQKRQQQYDVCISDADEHGSDCQVFCDGKLIHRWQAHQFSIIEPQNLQGKVLYKGFAQWANAFFTDPLENQAAFVLQKGYFVAQARMYDIDALAGERADRHQSMLGACYTYQPDVAVKAYRLENTTRDFSDTPEQLLRFN